MAPSFETMAHNYEDQSVSIKSQTKSTRFSKPAITPGMTPGVTPGRPLIQDEDIVSSPAQSEKPYEAIAIDQMLLPVQKIKQVIGQVLMVNGCEDLSRIDPIYAQLQPKT